ncbi:MAG TPA: c-type cytochrome [Caulobacteraceae bacterium]|nr:c-type cytochrome [Caulobacteraceae bacterium]
MPLLKTIGAVALALALVGCAKQGGEAASPVERGKYLVSILGCSDCHTPGGFTPKPDTTRYLGGSDSDFDLPGLGRFGPPNLTPDKATGLGSWTTQQIITAFTAGARPDGRVLSPAMPWTDFSNLTKDDAAAIAAYLQSLPPVSHKVPGPRAAEPCVTGAVQCIVARPGG